MKKIILTLCIGIMGLASAFAQEGRMAAGLNLGVAPSLESGMSVTNVGLGLKFQYNVTDPIRVEADIDYWFKSKGISVFDISANVHYVFNITEKFKVYPLAGIGYANIHSSAPKVEIEIPTIPNMPNIPGMPNIQDMIDEATEGADDSANASRFLFNIGAGADYDITDNLTANFEIKYQYLKDFSRMPISIGIAYKF